MSTPSPTHWFLVGGDPRHLVHHLSGEVVHLAVPHHEVGLPFVLLVLVVEASDIG